VEQTELIQARVLSLSLNTMDSKAGGSTTEMKKEVQEVGCYIVLASHEVLPFHTENKHMLSMISVEDSD